MFKPRVCVLFLCYSPYVDGGIMSNNPTMDLLTEIAEYNIAQRAVDKDTEVVEPTVCLSLGTGVPPVKKVSQSIPVNYGLINDYIIIIHIFNIIYLFRQP